MSMVHTAKLKSRGGRATAGRARIWLCTFCFLLLFAGSSFFLRFAAAASDAPALAVANQVTHDGFAKTGLFSDGSYLYVTEWNAGRQTVAKIDPRTGERSIVATPFNEARALDVSPDHSSLLISPIHVSGRNQELWQIPVGADAPQRVAEIAADDAAWSPDGERLVFANKFDLYVASRTGTKPTKLATLSGRPFNMRFSPDGRRVRFTVSDVETSTSSLWEIAGDGSNLHELLPAFGKPQRLCCGVWSADGRYYIFQVSQSAPTTLTSLWALDETALQDGKTPVPIRLTEGPMSFGNAWPSPDNNKIWALGVQPAGEVVEYNSAQNKFTKLLSGISASDLDFSPDGKWVSYVGIPDGTLWKSRADGSDRIQLTHAPDRAALPRWSPDGKQIAYVRLRPGTASQIVLASANGGKSEPAFVESRDQIDANWSADGSKILFGDVYGAPEWSVRLLNLKTHTISSIPGSERLFSPRWSPNGRYIAALSLDFNKVMLFDFHTRKWSTWLTEAAGAVSYPVWSADSKYLYFDDLVTDEESIRRVEIGDTQPERVFGLHGIDRYPGEWGLWSGRAPNGSWMFVRDRSTQEVYSLNLEVSK